MKQLDKLEQELNVGDVVVVPVSTSELAFARIVKLTPKGARVMAIKQYIDRAGNTNTFETDLVKRSSAMVKLAADDSIMLKLKGII